MRRLKKYVPILASILSSIFMFSVGFSSWLISSHPATVAEGQFGAYDAVKSDYIWCASSEMSPYSSLSFLTSDGEETRYGTLNVVYTLWLDNCKNLISSSSAVSDIKSISVKFDICYENAVGNYDSLFSTLEFASDNQDSLSRTVSVTVDGVQVESITNDGSSISFTHTITDLTSQKVVEGQTYFDVNVVYLFDIPKDSQKIIDGKPVPSNFRNAFGKYISVIEGNKTNFITSAAVMEVSK